jgi:DNA-binding transcriptional ArsR family regulator
MSAPAVSRHLKVLREAGLIHQRVAGTKRFYSVRPEAMRAIADWTMDHKVFWEASLDRLEAHLALEDPEEKT